MIWYVITLNIDVNECETEAPCHVNATCTNVDGSYYCACKANYSGDGFFCEGKCFEIVHQALNALISNVSTVHPHMHGSNERFSDTQLQAFFHSLKNQLVSMMLVHASIVQIGCQAL